VKDRPPEERRDFDDALVGQELREEAANGGGSRRVGRAEIDEENPEPRRAVVLERRLGKKAAHASERRSGASGRALNAASGCGAPPAISRSAAA
jgi:hypothetical protein